jgi:hypothetical protein
VSVEPLFKEPQKAARSWHRRRGGAHYMVEVAAAECVCAFSLLQGSRSVRLRQCAEKRDCSSRVVCPFPNPKRNLLLRSQRWRRLRICSLGGRLVHLCYNFIRCSPCVLYKQSLPFIHATAAFCIIRLINRGRQISG